MAGYEIKDSGKREEYKSGMVRDTQEGKTIWTKVLEGPMFRRWAIHLTNGARKYPDNADGTGNWTRANSDAELARFRQSAFRHFLQWIEGETDEDHAAAVYFNINCAEYVKARISEETTNVVPSESKQSVDSAVAQPTSDDSRESSGTPFSHGKDSLLACDACGACVACERRHARALPRRA